MRAGIEAGRNLPADVWLNRRGEPLISREDWEKLGRWRRLRDVLLGQDPVRDPRRHTPDL